MRFINATHRTVRIKRKGLGEVSPFAKVAPSTTQEIQKSQGVRLLDILYVGPLILATASLVKPPPMMRRALIVVGVLTILYNLDNFLANKDTS